MKNRHLPGGARKRLTSVTSLTSSVAGLLVGMLLGYLAILIVVGVVYWSMK